MTTRSRDYAASSSEHPPPPPAVEEPSINGDDGNGNGILEKDLGGSGSPSSSSLQTPSSTSEDLHRLNHDAHGARNEDNPNNTLDLEKQDTAQTSSGNQIRQRVSRVKTAITGTDHQFTHPLAHAKTAEDVIVDFDVRIFRIS